MEVEGVHPRDVLLPDAVPVEEVRGREDGGELNRVRVRVQVRVRLRVRVRARARARVRVRGRVLGIGLGLLTLTLACGLVCITVSPSLRK